MPSDTRSAARWPILPPSYLSASAPDSSSMSLIDAGANRTDAGAHTRIVAGSPSKSFQQHSFRKTKGGRCRIGFAAASIKITWCFGSCEAKLSHLSRKEGADASFGVGRVVWGRGVRRCLGPWWGRCCVGPGGCVCGGGGDAMK
jgi:hypothetical protein